VAKDGVPTIVFGNSGRIDYTVTIGDIELLEEPSFTQPSDVLKNQRRPGRKLWKGHRQSANVYAEVLF